MDQLAIKPQALAEMIRLIEDTTISGKIAKDILPELLEGKGNAGVKVRVRYGKVWAAVKLARHQHPTDYPQSACGCLGHCFAYE